VSRVVLGGFVLVLLSGCGAHGDSPDAGRSRGNGEELTREDDASAAPPDVRTTQAATPIAVCAARPSQGAAPLDVLLDGSASVPANDDEIVRYEWRTTDGETLVGQKVRHRFEVAGRYAVTLTLTSASGRQSTASSPCVVDVV
jgi:hypothetical protein